MFLQNNGRTDLEGLYLLQLEAGTLGSFRQEAAEVGIMVKMPRMSVRRQGRAIQDESLRKQTGEGVEGGAGTIGSQKLREEKVSS